MPLHIVIPQGTGETVGSGVTTYSGLVTTVGRWLNRSDLGDKIPDFITLLEARLNRILRVPEMEDQVTLSTTAESIDLPTDFRQARNLYLDADPRQELFAVTPGALRTDYACQTVGESRAYAIVGSSIVLGPAPDATYDLILDYYKDIPGLSASNETNWLISRHPDIYLWGTLLMAEFFGWNDERLPLIKGAWDESLTELTGQGHSKRFGTPLRLRASVSE